MRGGGEGMREGTREGKFSKFSKVFMTKKTVGVREGTSNEVY